MSGNFRNRIEQFIREQARPIEKFGHQPRLYALTQQIGKSMTYDDDVVFAATWLHDLGVFTGHRPEDPEALSVWDNTAYGIAKAPQVLSDCEFPMTKQAAVVETIRTHQPSSRPTSLEGEILRDADILEQLGAIGVMRAVCKVGRDTRFPDFTSAATSLRKALAALPAQIHLDVTRTLAQPRIALLQMFLAQLDAESLPALY